jgi:type II secretory pathway pseudopilin PulG
MSLRDSRGFTILEAVIALAIVGLAGVSALEAMGGEIRAADRAAEAYTLSALAQDRLAVLAMTSPRALASLPDSLARGEYAPPFTAYHWTAQANVVLGAPELYDVTVTIHGERRDFTVHTRLYRPVPKGILR